MGARSRPGGEYFAARPGNSKSGHLAYDAGPATELSRLTHWNGETFSEPACKNDAGAPVVQHKGCRPSITMMNFRARLSHRRPCVNLHPFRPSPFQKYANQGPLRQQRPRGDDEVGANHFKDNPTAATRISPSSRSMSGGAGTTLPSRSRSSPGGGAWCCRSAYARRLRRIPSGACLRSSP